LVVATIGNKKLDADKSQISLVCGVGNDEIVMVASENNAVNNKTGVKSNLGRETSLPDKIDLKIIMVYFELFCHKYK
jgi:hypothetical protein